MDINRLTKLYEGYKELAMETKERADYYAQRLEQEKQRVQELMTMLDKSIERNKEWDRSNKRLFKLGMKYKKTSNLYSGLYQNVKNQNKILREKVKQLEKQE